MNRYFILSFSLLPFIAANAQKRTDSKVDKPNVLLIYADDIGYGDLRCYGSNVETPHVDKLAAEGIRFLNAHSAAATSTPSRYAMLTGEYAWRRAGTGIAAGDAALIITPDRYTLADMFKNAGYSTGVVGKWHLGLGNETGKQNWNRKISPNPSDIGFDYSYIMAATGDRTPCVYVENGKVLNLDLNDPIEVSYTTTFLGEPTGKNNPELLTLHPSHSHNQTIVNGISRIGYMKGGHSARWHDEDIADSIVANSIRFLENQKGKDSPFFLYMATNDIHVPRVPHKRFVGKSGMGARGDALLSFDWSVGQVVAALKRLGMDQNTIIIISSDNGSVIDDGYKDQAVELLGNHKPAGELRGGKYSSFEGGTRVPCILNWKSGGVKPGVSTTLMSQMDWFASFASLLGVSLPTGVAPDSQNHLSSWFVAKKKGRKLLVEQNVNNNLSITDGTWKYIPGSKGAKMNKQTATELGNDSKPQLYNLVKDKSETQNLYHIDTKRAERLQLELTKIKEKDDK